MTSERGYDPGNVFARILRGEIPCDKVYEDEHVLAFRDVAPQAPVHVLVIPKGPYATLDDFAARASAEEIAAWVRAIGEVVRAAGLVEGGYRVLANAGRDGHQEVPHLHMHVFGGRDLGAMIRRG
ncbi:MAG TPA: histidine triad nucleotide-binding protein [Thermoanaerobaculia bacterium]|nr:histidine triad nucleotide-binding protein [Thermoanaerobaculia bacterium]